MIPLPHRRLATLAAALAGAATATACAKTTASPTVSWVVGGAGLDTVELPLGSDTRVLALRFDQARYQLQLLAPAGGVRVPDDVPHEAIAVWNGGYFEGDLRPSGLVLDQGREIAAPSRGSGLLLLGERFSLVRFRDTKQTGLGESALQLWPFLIEPGGDDGIHRDDGKRARRSAIALDDAGRGLLIAVLGGGISLYDLMQLCRRLGAVVAVNLDGGPSTGLAVTRPVQWREPSQTVVANALVLAARDRAKIGLTR